MHNGPRVPLRAAPMTTRSYLVSCVRLMISGTGRPALVINSALRWYSFRISCARRRACMTVSSWPVFSTMPKMDASAWHAAAINAPNRTAFSAWLEPSLQKRIFMGVAILFEMVARHQAIDDQTGSEERQRHEGEPDADAVKILGQGRADLRADGRAGVHDQRDQDVHVAFEGVGERSVTGGNHYLEQIGSDGDMRGHAENVHHRRHANVARAATEESAEHAADVGHNQDCPQGDLFDAGTGQGNHRGEMKALEVFGDVGDGRVVASGFAPGRGCFLAHLQRLPALPRDEG